MRGEKKRTKAKASNPSGVLPYKVAIPPGPYQPPVGSGPVALVLPLTFDPSEPLSSGSRSGKKAGH